MIDGIELNRNEGGGVVSVGSREKEKEEGERKAKPRGGKYALVGVSHDVIVIIHHLLTDLTIR
jgi:hypothetical protein